MDPITIVSGSLAIAKFAASLSVSVHEIWTRYNDAEAHIHSLIAVLHSLKLAMTTLSKNVVNALGGDLTSRLDDNTNEAVEVIVKACASLMKQLDGYVNAVKHEQSQGRNIRAAKYLWNESEITRLEERLDRQINALNLVLTTFLTQQRTLDVDLRASAGLTLRRARDDASIYTRDEDLNSITLADRRRLDESAVYNGLGRLTVQESATQTVSRGTSQGASPDNPNHSRPRTSGNQNEPPRSSTTTPREAPSRFSFIFRRTSPREPRSVPSPAPPSPSSVRSSSSRQSLQSPLPILASRSVQTAPPIRAQTPPQSHLPIWEPPPTSSSPATRRRLPDIDILQEIEAANAAGVKAWLDAGNDPNMMVKQSDSDQKAKVLYHVLLKFTKDRSNQPSTFQIARLLLDYGADPTCRFYNNDNSFVPVWSLLMTGNGDYAARLVRLFLDRGVSFKEPPHHHGLSYAISCRNLQMVILLLRWGVDTTGSGFSTTPLYDLISYIDNTVEVRHVVKVIREFSKAGADMDCPNSYGTTPVMRAVSGQWSCKLEIVKALVECGSSVNLRAIDANRFTVLHYMRYAFSSGGSCPEFEEIYLYLIAKGADPDALDGQGFLPCIRSRFGYRFCRCQRCR